MPNSGHSVSDDSWWDSDPDRSARLRAQLAFALTQASASVSGPLEPVADAVTKLSDALFEQRVPTEVDSPKVMYVAEGNWRVWQGSPTEIAQVANRAHTWMQERFGQQGRNYVYLEYVVATSLWQWYGRGNPSELRDEIDARRSVVKAVRIEAAALHKSMVSEFFYDVPLRSVAQPDTHSPARPALSAATPVDIGQFSSRLVHTPIQIVVFFQTRSPAVTLRVVGCFPEESRVLYNHIADHIEAGSRPRALTPHDAGYLGAALGVGAATLLIVPGLRPLWLTLAQVVFGGAMSCTGWLLARWAVPPLEPLEAWERSRWQTARAFSAYVITLALAVAGIVITILLATSGTPTH